MVVHSGQKEWKMKMKEDNNIASLFYSGCQFVFLAFLFDFPVANRTGLDAMHVH